LRERGSADEVVLIGLVTAVAGFGTRILSLGADGGFEIDVGFGED